MTDRREKVRELVEATGISHSIVISILHEQLGMKKLSTRWVPRLLTVDHKRDRVTISKQCFNVIQISALIHYCGRNMDPLLHTRDEGTVFKTMDFTG